MEPVVHRYVDYYFTPQSPWTYLGHARLVALAEAHRFIVRPKVADFGRVFSVSGGLPVGQRPLQRQSYRLLELERFASHMGVPMHVSPRYFPVDPTRASRRIAALVERADLPGALRYTGAVMHALWVDDRDIADEATLDAIADAVGIASGPLADASRDPAAAQRIERDTDEAIAAEVFGAPTYVPRFGPAAGQRFWGQDRLDFLERAVRG